MPSVAAAGRTPALWSVGLVGFLARGGFLLILLPMLALPSPVSLSVLIGPDLVDANGLSARVAALLVLAGGLVVLALVAGLVMAVLADIAAFEGILSATGVAVPSRARRPLARLVVKLLALQLAAAVPFLIALVPTVAVMAGVIRQEILLPSDQGLPLWWRVVESTWPWLVVVAATVLLASHIYSVVGRELLARHVGLLPPTPGSSALRRVLGAPAALLRRPGRAVAASVAVWAVGICGAVVAAALIALGWTIAQVAYLSPPTGATVLATVATWMAAAAGTAVLVGLLGAALVLLGATAAMRSALLTRAAVGGRGLA
ncbi:MAG TPA: hypothetical protein VID25_04845 [Candidatus Limnocylindrales bacterium]